MHLATLHTLLEAAANPADFDTTVPVYRGIGTKPVAGSGSYIQHGRTSRQSLTGSNIGMWMAQIATHHVPELSAMPDRSKSVFCTPSQDMARHFGHAVQIAPKRGVGIGWTVVDYNILMRPLHDFWYTIVYPLSHEYGFTEKVQSVESGGVPATLALFSYMDNLMWANTGFRNDLHDHTSTFNQRAPGPDAVKFGDLKSSTLEYCLSAFHNAVSTNRMGVANSIMDVKRHLGSGFGTERGGEGVEIWFEGDHLVIPLVGDDEDEDDDGWGW